ncbi:acyl carrier protein [Kitasatospora sp. MAA4]|uniref:phosphopantetheine-binding protein n=1 Tax=Kitasatospora sp. MAA4 TaxID=3035093 RepID=UPI0024766E35|nr:phosphopantetheine-binding protein [Kitasatospora sp. MAA4]MDH6134155.1 acyl carrier protein [Kitasatospora sp. MAA4]
MTRELDAALFRGICEDVLGAAFQETPEFTVYASTDVFNSGVGIRLAFRKCYGVDVRRVRFIDGLRWAPTGWCDSEADGSSPRILAEYVHAPPSDPVEQAITAFWEEILEVQGLGTSDDFWECGGDSLGFIETIDFIGQEYGVQLGFFDIGASLTVARLATLVRERSPR